MEALLNLLLREWPGVLFEQRTDLTFQFASPRLEALTGRPLALWQQQPELLLSVIHENDVDAFRHHLELICQKRDGVAADFRVRHATTGRVTYISEYREAIHDVSGKLTGYRGFWQDVTRQTVSERRMAAAVWKETLGLITLGLAHDFNNLLAGILGLSEQYLSEIDPSHPFHEGLSLMKRNTQQAAELMQRIGTLHRAKSGTRAYRDLNEIVRENSELLRKIIPRRIDFETETHSAGLPLYVDSVELQQMLINLALNAADAMPERGKLTVRTFPSTEPSLEHYAGVAPRLPAACLEVADTGVGIKARLLPHLFEPFFTTKPMNRGSGLGLYNARLFAEKHHGAISVHSVAGTGTTFRVWLPIANFTEADEALRQASRQRRSLLVAGKTGKHLDSTVEFLRQQNFQVMSGSADVEDLLSSSDYTFDGLVLLVEPQDTQAFRLARWVRQQKLPLKVILQTVGCNPDELDPQLLGKADLVISAETGEGIILDKIRATFDMPEGS